MNAFSSLVHKRAFSLLAVMKTRPWPGDPQCMQALQRLKADGKCREHLNGDSFYHKDQVAFLADLPSAVTWLLLREGILKEQTFHMAPSHFTDGYYRTEQREPLWDGIFGYLNLIPLSRMSYELSILKKDCPQGKALPLLTMLKIRLGQLSRDTTKPSLLSVVLKSAAPGEFEACMALLREEGLEHFMVDEKELLAMACAHRSEAELPGLLEELGKVGCGVDVPKDLDRVYRVALLERRFTSPEVIQKLLDLRFDPEDLTLSTERALMSLFLQRASDEAGAALLDLAIRTLGVRTLRSPDKLGRNGLVELVEVASPQCIETFLDRFLQQCQLQNEEIPGLEASWLTARKRGLDSRIIERLEPAEQTNQDRRDEDTTELALEELCVFNQRPSAVRAPLEMEHQF